MLHSSRIPAPAPVVLAALAGFLVALFGTYWDDAWHTEKGRDAFLIAPHLALYAGISLAGGALATWAALVVRARGLGGIRAEPALLLALIGMAVALGAAPLDNAWHVAFGRDAVIWSPPHMLGVAGNLAIAAALLLELSGREGRWERGAARLAAAAVLAVCVIPVLEYETDVPQFDLVFYLPLLATGAAFALALTKRAIAAPWVATEVAAIYTAIVAAIAFLLGVGGMPGPLVPLVILPAAIFDLLGSRRAGLIATAGAFAGAVYLAYVPYLNLLRSDLFLDAEAVFLGLPLALVGTAAALTIASLSRPTPRRATTAAALIALVLAAPLALAAPAPAHDPGQGDEITTAEVTARSAGDSATLAVSPAQHCEDLRPNRILARRAGETVSAPVATGSGCELSGEVALPERGRWFVYGEYDHGGERAETWLPIHAGEAEVRSDDARSLYVPPEVSSSPLKVIAGIAMYAVFLAVIVAVAYLFARRASAPSGLARGR